MKAPKQLFASLFLPICQLISREESGNTLLYELSG